MEAVKICKNANFNIRFHTGTKFTLTVTSKDPYQLEPEKQMTLLNNFDSPIENFHAVLC